MFVLELVGGEAFVTRWSVIPADIFAGHRWITILTTMFMHSSWSHIIGNMVYLWAFGPAIEDTMNPWNLIGRYARIPFPIVKEHKLERNTRCVASFPQCDNHITYHALKPTFVLRVA